MRLFVAVEVPAEVRRGLDAALEELRAQQPWLRWTDPDNWHLTLAFVGWVDESEAGAVADAVHDAARGTGPIDLALDGSLGSFGGRVLWAGMVESAPLAGLTDRIRAGLAERGFEVDERPLHAHLTVARAPRERRMPRALGADWRGPQDAWRVDEVTVMQSHLGREGARYETFSRAPLAP